MNETPTVTHPNAPGSGPLLLVFTLLLLVGIVHGVLAFGCYLINEHRRLSTLETAMLWVGDGIGLFWFLRYLLRWQLGRTDEAPRPATSSKVPKTAWIMLLSMAIGLLTELAMTLSLRYGEYAGFARAQPSTCTLHAVNAQIAQGAATYWKLDGQYQDAVGNTYPVTYYVRERDELHQLPGPIAQAIRQRQPLIDLPIVYDPKRPSRSWIPELGWDDGNRLHYLSSLILFFQFLVSMLFVVLLWDSIKIHRQLPSWAEYHSLIPLGTQAFIMALFGGIELYIVRRFCP